MKITRTLTENKYNVLMWDKASKSMKEEQYIDYDELKPEQIEKNINKALKAANDSRRVVEIELIESTSNLWAWDVSDIKPYGKIIPKPEYNVNHADK